MKNKELADLFERMADILEFKDENPFKINAYRKASRILGDLTQDIEEVAERGELKKISGIGEGIAQKIEEYLKTGKVSKFEEARKGVGDELIALMDIPGLGPKTLALIHKEKGIKNLSQLEKVVESGSLIGLPGMGEKKVENIKRGIQLLQQSKGRMNLGMAFPVAKGIVETLRKRTGSEKIEWAGSLRRMRENIGDIDILATSLNHEKIIYAFTHLPEVKEVLASGETKASVIVEGGLQIDLRVVKDDSYGAALQYFTGSKAHNIHLRGIAKTKGIKINEYGVFKGEKKIGGKEEKDVYKALGMDWIEPELREDRGEIEAAQEKRLPKLIEESDVKGDFHVHSNWSDGSSSIEEVARTAQKKGYQYIVISDHSKSLRIAHGLDETRLTNQMEEIDRINERMKGFRILKGTEVDILSDGRLDLSDKVLEKLDVVIGAVHSGFKQDREKMTRRIIRAIENPLVHIIAHPSGRLLGARDPYEVEMDELMEAAKRNGKALEINATLDRLDLDDIHCKKAKEMGIRLAIGTDAHHLDQMWMMSLGVAVARRGWLQTQDVLNTLSLKEIGDGFTIIE
ncbi:MAG: DNA polymerase/3'-5' exonuclease PolX [Deltaproteobacteria bacterium]|nr:DNA polymerase/3'-5' exonuclease PolX [Deltaproteobacteria bacterium]MBM4346692.1 DNA polymerase/3'-5' exonuclease PolX [Deltaproteobacteria bacterium]